MPSAARGRVPVDTTVTTHMIGDRKGPDTANKLSTKGMFRAKKGGGCAWAWEMPLAAEGVGDAARVTIEISNGLEFQVPTYLNFK